MQIFKADAPTLDDLLVEELQAYMSEYCVTNFLTAILGRGGGLFLDSRSDWHHAGRKG